MTRSYIYTNLNGNATLSSIQTFCCGTSSQGVLKTYLDLDSQWMSGQKANHETHESHCRPPQENEGVDEGLGMNSFLKLWVLSTEASIIVKHLKSLDPSRLFLELAF